MEGRRIIWRRKKYEEETDKVEETEIIYLYISIFINHPSISTFLSSLFLSLSHLSICLSIHLVLYIRREIISRAMFWVLVVSQLLVNYHVLSRAVLWVSSLSLCYS